MIMIGVCDDDMAFANTLSKKIRENLWKLSEELDCEIRTFFSADQVLGFVNHAVLQILFLDIDMPRRNGFELAELLQSKSPDTIIVFVSAYDNFVYESFRFDPFAFLRKGRLNAELPGTLKRVLEKFVRQNITFVFKTIDGNVQLRTSDIIYIESTKNYYVIHCKSDQSYSCRGTLSSIEEEMNDDLFYRIHPAFLVNMENIIRVGASRTVTMTGGTELSVSFRKWNGFHDTYMEYSRRRVIQV